MTGAMSTLRAVVAVEGRWIDGASLPPYPPMRRRPSRRPDESANRRMTNLAGPKRCTAMAREGDAPITDLIDPGRRFTEGSYADSSGWH